MVLFRRFHAVAFERNLGSDPSAPNHYLSSLLSSHTWSLVSAMCVLSLLSSLPLRVGIEGNLCYLGLGVYLSKGGLFSSATPTGS